MIRTLFLLLAWFVAVPSFSQGKPTSSSTQEQLLELRLEQQHLKEKLDDQKASLEEKFEVRKENLEYKSTRVGWWLSILALVLTVLPALGIFFGWKAYADIKKQRDKILDEQRDWNRKLTRIVYDKIKGLEEDAKEKLSKIVSEAKIELQKIKEKREADELIRTGSGAYLSVAMEREVKKQSGEEGKVKYDFSQQADLIEKSEYATPFQKAMAKALELYFTGKHEENIKQHLLILDKYRSELSLDELPSFYFRIAYSYAVLDKDDSAIEYYEKVVILDPGNSDAWNNLGSSYMKKNEKNEAIECFKMAMEIDEDALVCCNLGVAYLKNDNLDNAIEMFNKAIDLKPKDEGAWCSLGSVYVSKSNYDIAITKFNEALRLNPDYVLALANLAELLIIQNGNAEATLSKLRVVVNTEEDRFDYLLLETIRNAKFKIFKGTEVDAVDMLKQTVNDDANKVAWDFKIFNEWLAREKANPTALDEEAREFITELIRRIEEWRAGQPKA